MREVGQKMRFNDFELADLKSLFADDEDLLFAVRKHFLQEPLNQTEKDVLHAFCQEDRNIALLRKVFLPEIDGDAPLFQVADLRIALNTDLKTVGVEQGYNLIQAKDLEIRYLEQQMGALKGGAQKMKLADLIKLTPKISKEKAYINYIAWNYLLAHVDTNCQQIVFLAGMKTETVEETKKRLASNSNK